MHTFIRFRLPPLIRVRTVWMLGSHRRWVRRCECETDMPKPGPLPQTSQTAATSNTPWVVVPEAGDSPGRKHSGYPRGPAGRTPPGRYPRAVPRSLDAALLTGWIRAATQALERHRAEMDRINVFPVPDGDTGTNLLLTMRSAVASLRRTERDANGSGQPAGVEVPSVEVVPVTSGPELVVEDAAVSEPADGSSAAAVAAALARGALLGARGNSGVILSQVLRGVAEAVAAVGAIGVAAVGAAAAAGVRDRAVPAGGVVLADALSRAARLARAAVSRPREGTVLSVLASAATAAGNAGSDRLDEVAVAAADAAAGALRATTGQLPELAAAGVVDAGGLGLYLVLESLAELVSGRVSDELPEPAHGLVVTDALPPGEPDFEVMYLLDVVDPARIDGLRRRLDTLGESVALAEDVDGTWSVHVHTGEVGPAIEAGIDIGRPHRISVTPISMTRIVAEPPVRADRHAVLLVVAGDELAELAREAGAEVLQRTPGAQVGVDELVAALAATGAPEVVLMACDDALTEVAERAADTARAAGQGVVVMPSRSVLQCLAALAVHDPARRPGDDIVAMAEAAAGTRTGSLAVAEEEALTWVGRCQAGDVLGIVDGEVVLIAPDLAVGALWLAHRMLVGGGELVTVLLGADASADLADGLVADLRRTHPEVDVIVHRGGPVNCLVELGVE